MLRLLSSIFLFQIACGQTLTNETCVHECTPEESGLFAQGCCEPTFCQCFGGVGEVFQCQEEDQVFNEEIQNCDWAWHNPCCNETLVVPTTPPAEFCQSVDCSQDGYFSEGECEPDFCQCIGGAGHLLHCQDGLFFNEETHVCDWPWNNPGCFATTWNPNNNTTMGNDNGTTVTYGTTTGYNNGTTPGYTNGTSFGTTSGDFNATTTSGSYNGTTFGTTTTSAPQCSVDCSNMTNGFYAEGCCENTYCECFHGEGNLHSCPEGAVFNEEGGFCDDAENVACCSATTDLPTTTFPPVTTEAPNGECEFDCTNQEDGTYPEGCCIPNYCVCTEGVGSVHSCINGTVYDEIAGFCHHPNNVECCQHTTSMINLL